MAAAEFPPYDVHLPYEGEACGEFMSSRLMDPLDAAGYRTYTTKYYLPGQPLLDEFIKGVQQSRVTVLPLCQTFMDSQYYWYVENSIHDRSVIREGSVIFVRMEEGCSLSQKLRPFGFLDFTTDAAYEEAYPRLLRTLGPPSSAPQPQQHPTTRADDIYDGDTYDDVFVNNDVDEDQQMPRSNFVHATHRTFDAMGPQILIDLVEPEKALLSACKEFEWSEWSLKAFCQDPDSYIQRVQKITPPLRDDVEKVLLLAILPQQQTHRGSCITLAKLSCCGLPRVEGQALEALLTVIHHNIFHQGTDYAESGGLSDVTREVLYVLSNRDALRQWTRGTTLLRIQVCCVLLICLHVSYVNGDVGLEFSAEELKKTQNVIKHKIETFDATDLSFRCLADYYIHTIYEASKRIAGKSVGKFKELVMQAREVSSTKDPKTAKQLVKDICKAEEYDQQIVLSYLADMAYDTETALEIFQRAVCKLAQTCSGSRADRLFILTADMFVKILQTTKRSDLCSMALRPPPPHGKRKKLLGLAELWYEQQFHQGTARLAVEVLCRPLLHHPQPTVRETMARRLAMRQGRVDDIEWEDLVPIEAKHISDQYKLLGLRIVTHQPTPCQDLEDHVVWKGTTTHGNVAVKVYKMSSMQDLMSDGDRSEGARTVRNNVRMLGELSGSPNILRLLAYQLRPQPVFHITEFMEEGNLLDFLLRKRKDHQHTRSSLLYLRSLLTLLLDMVAALRYCHSNNIVHRDVIARNFLVYRKRGTYRCKLGNFNMAAKAPMIEEETYECPDCLQIAFQGSCDDPVAKLWTAPESMVGYQFSDKSDVWMLGCAMYEVLTHGCRPFTEMWGMAADDIVQQVVFGLRPRQPSCVPRKLFQSAMLPCFLADPAERIALVQLERKLRSYLKECPLPGVEHIDDIHPPPRLSPNQSTRPERGIPRNLETQISSEPEATGTEYKIEKGKFPCSASEILAYDQPNGQGEEFLLLKDGQVPSVDRRRKEMLQRLDHVNIRRVMDIVINGNHVKQMSQTFSGGQPTLLAAARDKRLSVDDMVLCLSQVADAMAFAHGTLLKGEGVIHCDLRAMYVICDGQHVKVGRWGRASHLRLRLYDTKLSESVVTKPMPQDALRWSPMEVIESGIYSQGSDVFTFGQVCWEVFHAYNADRGSENRMLAPYPYLKATEVLPYLQRRQRPLQPCDCPDWLYRLMKLCWLDERSRRPGFDKIAACFKSPSTSTLLDIGDDSTYKKRAPGGNEDSLNAALNHQDRHYFRQGLLQSNADYTTKHGIGYWVWDADNVSQGSADTFYTMTSDQTVDTVSSDLTSGTWQSAESRSRAGTDTTRLSEGSQRSVSSSPSEDLVGYTTLDLESDQSVAGSSRKSSRGQEVMYNNSLSMAPLVAELSAQLQGAQPTNGTDDVADETSDATTLDNETEEESETRLLRKTSFLNPSYGSNVPTRFHGMQESVNMTRPENPAFSLVGANSPNTGDEAEANDDADYYTKLVRPTSSNSAHSVPSPHHRCEGDTNQPKLPARPPVPPRPSTMAASPEGREGSDSAAAATSREGTPPPPVPPRVFLNSADAEDAQDDPPYADVRVRRKSQDAVPPTHIPRPLSRWDLYNMQRDRRSQEWNQESCSKPSSIVRPIDANALRPRVHSDTSLSSQDSSYRYNMQNDRRNQENTDWKQESNNKPSSTINHTGVNTLRYRVHSDTSLSSQGSSYLESSQESLAMTSKQSSPVNGTKGVVAKFKKVKGSVRRKFSRKKGSDQGDRAGGARGDHEGVFRYTSEADARSREGTSSVCSDYRDGNTDENSDQEEFDTRL